MLAAPTLKVNSQPILAVHGVNKKIHVELDLELEESMKLGAPQPAQASLIFPPSSTAGDCSSVYSLDCFFDFGMWIYLLGVCQHTASKLKIGQYYSTVHIDREQCQCIPLFHQTQLQLKLISLLYEQEIVP